MRTHNLLHVTHMYVICRTIGVFDAGAAAAVVAVSTTLFGGGWMMLGFSVGILDDSSVPRHFHKWRPRQR